MLAAIPVWADENSSTDAKPEFYRANELSLDLFGTGSVGRYTLDHVSGNRIKENGRLGAGAGLNYFFTRNLGLGLDAYSENTAASFVDSGSANLILRLPLGQSRFAPYIFGGGGRNFEQLRSWFADAGAGIECRITPHLGAFVDARGALPDKGRYYGVGRAGLRLAF